MKITDTSDLWWKSAVIYCLDVETFMDDNGDGIGDFGGLAWRDSPPKKQEPTVFPGEEASVWELDERTGQYFQHVFYKHQHHPDRLARARMGRRLRRRLRRDRAPAVRFPLAAGVTARGYAHRLTLRCGTDRKDAVGSRGEYIDSR